VAQISNLQHNAKTAERVSFSLEVQLAEEGAKNCGRAVRSLEAFLKSRPKPPKNFEAPAAGF